MFQAVTKKSVSQHCNYVEGDFVAKDNFPLP
jgi:hypothetical protein